MGGFPIKPEYRPSLLLKISIPFFIPLARMPIITVNFNSNFLIG